MKQNLRETIFLGWDKPILPLAADSLIKKYSVDQQWDLSSLLCVLPTARSSNRLGTLLSDLAASSKAGYQPPTFITVGELPEQLYGSDQPAAIEFEQTLAWAAVMRDADPEGMAALLPNLPPREPMAPWLELAGTVRRLHEDLASSNLTFEEVAQKTETESETRRWRMLAELSNRYAGELARVGLIDPDFARAEAIEQNRCKCDQTVVLIGTSDISDMLLKMLGGLNGDIVAMVAAPKSEAARFDQFGCVKTSAWIDHELPLRDENLLPAGDVSDQAIAAVESVTQLDGKRAVVGVTDQTHVGPVEMELRGAGRSTFRAIGWTVASTSIGRLFDLTATHVQSDTWQSLAALVRHSHVSRAITASLQAGESLQVDESSTWLREVDQLLANHYPRKISGTLPPQAIKNYPLAIQVGQWVQDWLSVFDSKDQPLSRWCKVISEWLGAAVDQTDASANPRTSMAINAANKILTRFASLNDGLDFSVSGGLAIEMMAGRLADLRVVGTPETDAIEIVGWLDLSLDDADSLSVIGLNHPFVPSATTSDPFLPGSIRSSLRMADNQRRYARDVYAMHLMLSVREKVHFIVGKIGADGSPTPPSRLIAASPKPDSARRVRFLLEGSRSLPPVSHAWDAGPKKTSIAIPQFPASDGEQIVKRMSVTAFKDYLTCPYRFYLRHVLRIKPIDDEGRELAANQFGDLVHGALETFGQSGDKDETSASKIEAALIEHLHDYADNHFGGDVSAAVLLQVTQAERRLATVALRQAERIAEGWTIHATEASVDEKSGAAVTVDEGSVGLRGRFDRIDFHAETNRWAILDYKTHGHPPEKKHLKKVDGVPTWVDLQLPLYRMMVPYLGIDAPPHEVELGYFNVSDKDDETKINLATFSEEQMIEAEEKIRDCVSRVLREEFEPTDKRVEFDDYAMILQEGIAGRILDAVGASE
ncbi:PD-(D/E)XK nuclease family protein [Rubripirellula obstinata]|uniref:PD-(D/E)XK nuclease family protein n=1 Tax=Rubripirellula obstinata TaxID=406547 RepID=UPI000829D4D5|nr:PD-(D/E)XK nuclease family protein [Rubripirellula obstinata]